jgi:hypothetical protein
MGHPKPAAKLTFNDLPFLGLNLQYFLSKPIKIKGVQNNLLYPRFSEKTNKNWKKKKKLCIYLMGCLGDFSWWLRSSRRLTRNPTIMSQD